MSNGFIRDDFCKVSNNQVQNYYDSQLQQITQKYEKEANELKTKLTNIQLWKKLFSFAQTLRKTYNLQFQYELVHLLENFHGSCLSTLQKRLWIRELNIGESDHVYDICPLLPQVLEKWQACPPLSDQIQEWLTKQNNSTNNSTFQLDDQLADFFYRNYMELRFGLQVKRIFFTIKKTREFTKTQVPKQTTSCFCISKEDGFEDIVTDVVVIQHPTIMVEFDHWSTEKLDLSNFLSKACRLENNYLEILSKQYNCLIEYDYTHAINL